MSAKYRFHDSFHSFDLLFSSLQRELSPVPALKDMLNFLRKGEKYAAPHEDGC
jgi:hypothetical protein